jgi:hypothetical protein
LKALPVKSRLSFYGTLSGLVFLISVSLGMLVHNLTSDPLPVPSIEPLVISSDGSGTGPAELFSEEEIRFIRTTDDGWVRIQRRSIAGPDPTPDPDDTGTGHVSRFFSEDQQEVLKRLFETDHPWAAMVKGFADNDEGVYGDFGQWATIAWFATGDNTYGRRAIKHFDKAFIPAINSRSYTRELFGVFALQYSWLRPLMTDAEAQDFRSRLFAWADLVFDPTVHGTRVGDSDEVVGHFIGVKLMLKALEKEEPERCAAIAANPQLVAWREEIKRYCELARGGEWVESNEYNLGTLQLLLIGAYGLGEGELPEVDAVLKEAAIQQRWQITPDFTASTQWGDEQGRELFLNYRVTLNAMFAGLVGDPQSGALVRKLTGDKPPYSAYWFTLYRALWCFDPSALTPTYAAPQGFRTTRIGLTIHRGNNYLCQIFGPTWNGVDHENATYPSVRMRRDGEWVLDHPQGYQGTAQTQNVPIMAGHCRMAHMETVAEETPTGCRVTWRTNGKLPNSWAHFMNDFIRTIEFTAPSKIVVVDSFDGRKPTAEELWYGDLVEKTAKAPALWQVIYHAPVEPTVTETGVTWQTLGGKTVTITAEGHERQIVIPTSTSPNLGGWFGPGELDGWQVRFLSDAPQAVIKTTVDVTETPATSTVLPANPIKHREPVEAVRYEQAA